MEDRHLSIDIVRAVRETVGPEVQSMIEGHSRFSVSEAVYVGDAIAEFEPTWFEEPTPHQNIDSTVEVARKINVPVATGESYSSIHQHAELLSLWQNKSRPSAAVKRVAAAHLQGLKQRIAEMQSMVGTLEHLSEHCHGDHRPDCPILEDLART